MYCFGPKLPEDIGARWRFRQRRGRQSQDDDARATGFHFALRHAGVWLFIGVRPWKNRAFAYGGRFCQFLWRIEYSGSVDLGFAGHGDREPDTVLGGPPFFTLAVCQVPRFRSLVGFGLCRGGALWHFSVTRLPVLQRYLYFGGLVGAGASRLPWLRFALADMVGAVLWTFTWVGLGVAFAYAGAQVDPRWAAYAGLSLLVAGMLVAALFGRYLKTTLEPYARAALSEARNRQTSRNGPSQRLAQ